MSLLNISSEILLNIFSFINVNDTKNIQSILLTCKSFKALFESIYLKYFFPIDVEDSQSNNEYILKLHGILKNGDKAIVNIINYKPFFDILLNKNNLNILYQ
jgi:hypothetical protein